MKDVNTTLNGADTKKGTEFGNTHPYIGMKLLLKIVEEEILPFARVNREVVDEDGKPIGIPSKYSILDSRQYEI